MGTSPRAWLAGKCRRPACLPCPLAMVAAAAAVLLMISCQAASGPCGS